MKHYDVIVIGTGAGNIIIEEATRKGLKCAQIEKGKFGGTCLTRGCIPTKVMVTAAEELRSIKEASKIGVLVENPRIDWKKLSQRVWHKIDDESKELEEFYLNEENVDVYKGIASFLSDKEIKIKSIDNGEDTVITGDKIFINVGGRSRIPKIDGLEEVGYVSSELFFGEKYPDKPYKELIVMGGGPIGVEFASTFAAFGTKVTLVQRNVRLLPKEDEEISSAIKEYLEEVGVEVYLAQDAISIRRDGDKKVLLIRDKNTGEEREVSGEELMIASGIVSNSDLLNLENTNIQVDENGWIRTNEFLETSVDKVWAIGDINGKVQFRHKANYEADIVAYNLFIRGEDDGYRWADYSLVPAVTFSYPEVAHVGMTEKEAKEKGYNIKVGVNHYHMTAKGYSLGYEDGGLKAFAKLIVDRDKDKLLGIHIIGKSASTLIQPYLNLMNTGKKEILPINDDIEHTMSGEARNKKLKRKLKGNRLQTIRETMVPHPTLAEVPIWTFYYMEDK